MSLQVWLPLNGDLRNLGLSDVLVTTPTVATFDNAGKIGKCLLYNSKVSIPAILVASIFNNEHMSIAFWYNNNGGSTSSHSICGFLGNSEGDSGASRIYDFFQYSSKNDFHWSMGTLGGGVLNGVIPDNTWIHICVIYNSGNLKIYINGILNHDSSGHSSAYTFNKSYYINFGYGQKLNDFRIYDHALSVKEVKEIAKGLVLHYPLNDKYSSGNLILNGFGESGQENWANSNYSTSDLPSGQSTIKAKYWNNTTNEYIPIGRYRQYTFSAYLKSTGATSGTTYPSLLPYDVDKKFIQVYNCAEGFNNLYVTTLALPLNPGDTVIYATNLSAWTTATDNYYYHVAIFGYLDSTGYTYPDMEYTADSPAFGTKADKSKINKTNNTITLNSAFTGKPRPAGTKICQATEGNVNYYPFGGIALSSIANWTFKTATFIPNNVNRLKCCRYLKFYTWSNVALAGIKLVDDYNIGNTVYDTSGYKYNGIASGITISTDSAKYNYSTKFVTNTDTITPTAIWASGVTVSQMSVSIWFKTNTLNSTAPNLWSLGENSFARIRIASATSILYYIKVASTNISGTYTTKTLTDNVWHHVVFTFNNGVVIMYIDGAQVGTTNHSSTGTSLTMSSTSWHLAGYTASQESFLGSLSDFRVYATALSADDVKELYGTAAQIDKNGNIYAYEFKEG